MNFSEELFKLITFSRRFVVTATCEWRDPLFSHHRSATQMVFIVRHAQCVLIVQYRQLSNSNETVVIAMKALHARHFFTHNIQHPEHTHTHTRTDIGSGTIVKLAFRA